MIDFHSHIIPEIDDGSRSIEETMLLLEEAQKAGFTKIICTSHYLEEYYEFDEASRKQFLEMLKIGVNNLKLNVELYLGSEIYTSYDIVDLLKTQRASTINNTNYVLIELPMQSELPNLKNVMYTLIGNGYIPIIAHPERYSYVKENPNWLLDYIELGVLFQANYGSIIGMYGRESQKTVKLLLKHDMIHFLGSDVHRPKTIYAKMPEILQELQKVLERDKLKRLTKINPQLVLENETIHIQTPTKIKKRIFEFLIYCKYKRKKIYKKAFGFQSKSICQYSSVGRATDS